jgi:hypothetical protein
MKSATMDVTREAGDEDGKGQVDAAETREASMDADNGDAVQRRMTSTESDGRLS